MSSKRKSPAPLSDAEQEERMINLAIKRAEQQLIDGTASASTINHYLRLASSSERLDRAKKRQDVELASAKLDAINKQTDDTSGEDYRRAYDAFRGYQGLES